MIAIVNRKCLDGRAGGEHEYSLQINNRILGTFTHHRELGLAECLRQAAKCADEYEEKERIKWLEMINSGMHNE